MDINTSVSQCQSPTLGALALALSRAQGEMHSAKRESENPTYHKGYADLASCWDACRKPLADNRLAVIQTIQTDLSGDIHLVSTLIHGDSGEWMRSDQSITACAQDPQSVGSAVTYARRYALCAMVGIASEDDDAETAMGRKNQSGNFAGKEQQGKSTISTVKYSATANQVRVILEIAREQGVDGGKVAGEMIGHPIDSLEHLTKAQASDIISRLSKRNAETVIKEAV